MSMCDSGAFVPTYQALTFKHEMYVSADGTISETQDELIRVRQERDEAQAEVQRAWGAGYAAATKALHEAATTKVERLTRERDEAEEGRILLGQALQAAVDDRNCEVQKLKAERDGAHERGRYDALCEAIRRVRRDADTTPLTPAQQEGIDRAITVLEDMADDIFYKKAKGQP
jgi:hypothetical protein